MTSQNGGGPGGAPAAPAPSGFRKVIRTRHAIALYVSSVVGSGILVLPGLAARIAGPASLLAWALLAVASLPFALTFAALSARHPEAGGIYGFAKEAFGPRVGLVIGWLFAQWVLTGAPAVALIAASYLGYAFPLDRPETYVLAFGITAAAFAVNYQGIRMSARVQLGLVVAILALLVVTVGVAGVRVRASHFVPFFPDGVAAVGTAAALIFWSFLGYENVSNVAEEFADPQRDFPRAVYASVGIVGVLYFAVAVVTVGTDAYAAGGSVAPFAAILGDVFGPFGAAATALLAVVLLFGVENAYTAGMSRVMFATARDGGFPAFLGRLDPRTGIPRAALLTLFVGIGAVLALFYVFSVDLTTALLIASGAALLCYIVGSAAGVRLRPAIGRWRTGSYLLPLFSLGLSVVIFPFIGWPVLVPLAVVAAALLYSAARPPSPR